MDDNKDDSVDGNTEGDGLKYVNGIKLLMIFVTRASIDCNYRVVRRKAREMRHTTRGLYRNSRGTEPGYEYNIIHANDMSRKWYTIAVYTVPIARSHIYFRNAVAKLSRGFLARDVFQSAIIPARGSLRRSLYFLFSPPVPRW